ncbi:hypothetical protein GGQ74_002145 [Desulfobaculum xiamenense]|uniref:Uncharacterized protein n=1 Tax=Desulfobaculum xiamenense TaxID=995050 RepID=A0A846QPP9_9BACT|nr:hypothetical protein [Desulfobaculum xiamenense]NJB68472.1 hypothetical protein [Desulfobaculum xiamenense]
MTLTRRNSLLLVVVLAALVAGFWVWNSLKPKAVEAPAPVVEAPATDYVSELPAPVSDDQNATAEQSAPPAEEVNASQVRGVAAPEHPQDDAVVTPDFVRDIARLCATNYHPAHTRNNDSAIGMTTLTFKKLNMHYGVNLTGLHTGTRDVLEGRTAVLNHLMSPIALRLVYGLYADAFVQALGEEALAQTREYRLDDGGYAFRSLTEAEARGMLTLYAQLVDEIGLCFRTFARQPKLVDAMRNYTLAARNVNAAYGTYADLEASDAAQAKLDAVAQDIKQALTERDRLRNTILAMAMPTKSRKLLTGGDVMDIATWISRRLATNPDNINGIGALASLSEELSTSLRSATPTPQADTAQAQP